MSEKDSWTLQRVKDLCNDGICETVNLEFKRSDAIGATDSKRKELSKDISALANSDGGIIIYGIAEHEGTHSAGNLDSGIDQAQIKPEWIEQVANSNIHPKIEGLRVIAVPIDDETDGRVTYVVEVPRSSTAHMAADNKYYKRRGSTNSPMEDYEVRDTMARDVVPALSLEVEFAPTTGMSNVLDLRCYLVNESLTPADWCLTQLSIPKPLEIMLDGGATRRDEIRSDSGWPVTALLFTHGGPNVLPIWQGPRTRLGTAPNPIIRLRSPAAEGYPLAWRVTAPRMGWRNGQLILQF
ncbi:helix-turn-helix domain-containing protein [Ferrimicrobium sp.]|uniref:AlbA family DNA-binding domain-containing protein n=1 Tax=Ferrimicrobium sp. TaxID=2926050 RepID=UPI002614B899|nr:ATP-binding protein [Ferrimicrobium sp.]